MMTMATLKKSNVISLPAIVHINDVLNIGMTILNVLARLIAMAEVAMAILVVRTLELADAVGAMMIEEVCYPSSPLWCCPKLA